MKNTRKKNKKRKYSKLSLMEYKLPFVIEDTIRYIKNNNTK